MSVYLQNALLDEAVYQFIDSNRAESKPYRVCMIASANKFLQIYYATMKAYLEVLAHTSLASTYNIGWPSFHFRDAERLNGV